MRRFIESFLDARAILSPPREPTLPNPQLDDPESQDYADFGGEKGNYRIQHTLIPGLSRHKSSARLVNAYTYEGPASRTNTLKRGFSVSRFARALPAVPPGLCTLLLFAFRFRFENLPPMITKSKGGCFGTSSKRSYSVPWTRLTNASVAKGSMLNVIGETYSLTFYG